MVQYGSEKRSTPLASFHRRVEKGLVEEDYAFWRTAKLYLKNDSTRGVGHTKCGILSERRAKQMFIEEFGRILNDFAD